MGLQSKSKKKVQTKKSRFLFPLLFFGYPIDVNNNNKYPQP